MNNSETQTNIQLPNLDSMDTKVPFHKVWKESLGRIPIGFRITSGLMVFIFVAFIAMLAITFQTKPFRPDMIWAVVIIFGFVILVVGASIWRGYINYRDFVILNEVAKANNFEVVERIDNPQYAGSLFRAGKIQPIYSLLKGVWEGKKFELFNLIYVSREGTRSSTNYAGIILVKLSKSLPNVVFDNKSNNFMGISSLGNVTPSPKQKVQLEGDFNKYFDVYVPKDYEREMLYFITPDLMQLLIQIAKDFDIEIINDELYVYSTKPFDFSDKSEYKKIFELISLIGGKLSENTQNFESQVATAQPAASTPSKTIKLRKFNLNIIFTVLGFAVGILIWIVANYTAV